MLAKWFLLRDGTANHVFAQDCSVQGAMREPKAQDNVQADCSMAPFFSILCILYFAQLNLPLRDD